MRALPGILTLAFAVCLAVVPAYAVEYSVTPTNVNTVIASAKAGDIITFENGIYNNVNIDFKPSQHGTKEKPITLRAETQGGVVFRGNGSKLRFNRNWLVVDGFVWEDITINGSNDYVIRFNNVDDNVFRNNILRRTYNQNLDASVVRIATSSDRNIIERNEFTAPDNTEPYRMIQVWAYKDSEPALGNIIRYNYFHDTSRVIQLGQGANTNPRDPYLNTVIEGNLFENLLGYPLHIKTSGNSFINNTVRNSRSAADVRTGAENSYIGNYFFDSLPISLLYGEGEVRDNYFQGGYNTTDRGEAINLGWGDIEYPGISEANAAQYYEIANNTMVGFADAAIDFDLRKSVVGHDIPPQDNHFANNLIWNSAGRAIHMEQAVDQTWEANVVWSTNSGIPGDTPNGVQVIDPGLVQNAHGLWYSSKFPDVGADVSRRPLTALDVGPGSSFTYVQLVGDFNDDGIVNLADYVVWRNALGSSKLLPNDQSAGTVTLDDYQDWKANFGASLTVAQQKSVAVPEPQSLLGIALLSGLASSPGWLLARDAKVQSRKEQHHSVP